MLRNLLPQGTRTVELCSAYALILLGVSAYFLGLDTPELFHLEPHLEWVVLLIVFGGLQFYSILNYPRVEILRTSMGWLAGCFWLYVGVVSSTVRVSPEDIACIMLGMGNLYGFVLNFNLIKAVWKP